MPEVLTRVGGGKSAFEVERRINEIISADLKLKAEHERLRAAVVEAVKVWHSSINHIGDTTYFPDEKIRLTRDANQRLFDVTDTLLAFEAENKIGVDHE